MEQILNENWIFFLIIVLWQLFWKGLALWKAARNNHKKWFVALLVIQTLGLMEIIYVYFFSSKEKSKEINVETTKEEKKDSLNKQESDIN